MSKNYIKLFIAVSLCISPLDSTLLSADKLCLDAVRRFLSSYRASVGVRIREKAGTVADSFGMDHTSSVFDPLWGSSRILQ